MMESQAAKRRSKADYADLLFAVNDILRLRDPVGLIEMGAPADEYAPEAESIVARMREMASEDDVWRIVTEEFVRWFGADTWVSAEALQLASGDVWTCIWRLEA
ncbi:MAG TPA: hypothetical protein VGM51_19000 [Armatimonadota bacterium]|jgi:hypothetical protein